MPKFKTFDQKYPYLCHFVEEQGWIEIGQSEYIDSFVRAYDFGGTVDEGKASYSNMEVALQDLEAGIRAYVEKWGI